MGATELGRMHYVEWLEAIGRVSQLKAEHAFQSLPEVLPRVILAMYEEAVPILKGRHDGRWRKLKAAGERLFGGAIHRTASYRSPFPHRRDHHDDKDPFVGGLGHHDSLRRVSSPDIGGEDQFASNTVTGADEVDTGVATGRQVVGRGLLKRTKGTRG